MSYDLSYTLPRYLNEKIKVIGDSWCFKSQSLIGPGIPDTAAYIYQFLVLDLDTSQHLIVVIGYIASSIVN